jgi:hypothetical protein
MKLIKFLLVLVFFSNLTHYTGNSDNLHIDNTKKITAFLIVSDLPRLNYILNKFYYFAILKSIIFTFSFVSNLDIIDSELSYYNKLIGGIIFFIMYILKFKNPFTQPSYLDHKIKLESNSKKYKFAQDIYDINNQSNLYKIKELSQDFSDLTSKNLYIQNTKVVQNTTPYSLGNITNIIYNTKLVLDFLKVYFSDSSVVPLSRYKDLTISQAINSENFRSGLICPEESWLNLFSMIKSGEAIYLSDTMDKLNELGQKLERSEPHQELLNQISLTQSQKCKTLFSLLNYHNSIFVRFFQNFKINYIFNQSNDNTIGKTLELSKISNTDKIKLNKSISQIYSHYSDLLLEKIINDLKPEFEVNITPCLLSFFTFDFSNRYEIIPLIPNFLNISKLEITYKCIKQSKINIKEFKVD